MTKIILVRHGHVEGIDPPRFRGRLDLPLTEKGRTQALATAGRIESSWRPSAVYTSPMSRAVDTGAAIAGRFNLEIRRDARLTDLDYGQWQGLTYEEVKSRWPHEWETWNRTPQLARIPGGEPLLNLQARLVDCLVEIAGQHPTDTIVIVGHDRVNRAILLLALDLPLSRFWYISQGPCAINELELREGQFSVMSLNETHHLVGPA